MTVDDLAIEADAAQEQVRMGIYISAVRCLLSYLVVPAVSATGALAGLLGAGGIALQILGAAVCTFGAIQLWQLRHRARYLYGAVTLCVYLATALALVGLA
ncbi:MAG: hypothetical protein ACRCYU_01090 [Nocardioides sp.]